jgi:hypothetical protein
MNVFGQSILLSAIVATGAFGGCGTYVPDIQEFWGTPEDNAVKVNLITGQVVCELRRAVQRVLWENAHTQTVYIGGPNPPPKKRDLKWFETWSVQTTLTLAIVENTAASPGVALNTIRPNAITRFPNGNVTTPQSFTFGFGGTLSATATRTDKLNMFFRVQDLRDAHPSMDLTCIPSTRANADLFIQSDLKLYDWLSAALLPYDAHIINYANNSTAQNAISHQVKFDIVSNGNVNPQWKLVQISANTGTTPLLAAGRNRTQELLITFGPTQNGMLAVPAQSLHTAGEIGTAVGQAVKAP